MRNQNTPQTEEENTPTFKSNLAFFDYSGIRRSFNVEIYAPDIWIGHPQFKKNLEKHRNNIKGVFEH